MTKTPILKYVFFTLLITLFTNCEENTQNNDSPILSDSQLTMTIKSGAGISSAESEREIDSIIENINIFLFDGKEPSSTLKQNITNLTRNLETNTVKVNSVKVGDWYMRSISSIDPVEFAPLDLVNGVTKESLLYKFEPTKENNNAPQIVLFANDISIKESEIESVSVQFKRAVGKVSLAIVDVKGDIKLDSKNHTVEIIGVPCSMSIEGGLLRDGKHNRANPDTLDSKIYKMIQPITIHATTPKPASNATPDYDYYPKSVFIIPAYDDNASPATLNPHTDNKTLIVKISLETNSGTYYVREAKIDKALSANKQLFVKINVQGDFEVTTDIIEWTIWVSNPEL